MCFCSMEYHLSDFLCRKQISFRCWCCTIASSFFPFLFPPKRSSVKRTKTKKTANNYSDPKPQSAMLVCQNLSITDRPTWQDFSFKWSWNAVGPCLLQLTRPPTKLQRRRRKAEKFSSVAPEKHLNPLGTYRLSCRHRSLQVATLASPKTSSNL